MLISQMQKLRFREVSQSVGPDLGGCRDLEALNRRPVFCPGPLALINCYGH